MDDEVSDEMRIWELSLSGTTHIHSYFQPICICIYYGILTSYYFLVVLCLCRVDVLCSTSQGSGNCETKESEATQEMRCAQQDLSSSSAASFSFSRGGDDAEMMSEVNGCEIGIYYIKMVVN